MRGQQDQPGDLTISGAIDGAGGLIKAGAGTAIISNTANTFTGNVTIDAGTFELGASNVIPDSNDIVLGGGTFNSGGFSETAGNLTLSQNSVVDLAAGASILDFEDFIDTAAQIDIWNWSGTTGTGAGTDQLIFDITTFGSLSAGQLAKFRFFSGSGVGLFTGPTIQLVGGEVLPDAVAVPEPSTWFGGGGIVVFAITHYIRRQRKKRQNSV